MRRFIAVLTLSLAAVTASASAEQLTRAVPVTQADLQSDAAVAALYKRVERTAKSLCTMANPGLYGQTHTTLRAREACMREAVAKAVGDTGSPSLAGVHAQTVASAQPDARTETLAAR